MRTKRAWVAATAAVTLTACEGGAPYVPPEYPTHIAFAAQPTSAPPTASLGSVKVVLLDSDGSVVEFAKGNVVLSLFAPGSSASLAGTTTVSTVNGVAEFTNVSVAKAGTGYRLSASVEGFDTVLSEPFDISLGPPTNLKVTRSGETAPGLATYGQAGTPTTVTVDIVDAGNNVIPTASASITMSLTRLQNFGTTVAADGMSGTTTVATVAGTATFNDLTFNKSGVYRFDASGGGFTGSASGHIVQATTISRLIFLTQPTDGSANVTLPTFSVLAVDVYGNAIGLPPGGNYTATIALGANPTGAALTGTLSYVAAGVSAAPFGNIKVDKPGTGYTLVANATTGSGVSLTSATSAPFNVVP